MARVRTFAVALLALLALPAAAGATPYALDPDGTTAETYAYSTAIRQRVYIPQLVDQNGDGVSDDVAIEIIRPAAAEPVPAIVDPSPYYSTVCRGNEGQCIADTNGDGVNDRWPLFLDNYFVPRGYAVVLAESNGTANSTGCPLHGGVGDVAGMRSVIDWLNGRVPGYSDAAHAHPALATWHDGSSAMIGKSYDGTLTNAVAATGVSRLKTIVPESAIDDWYAYSRMGGIRFNAHYPSALSGAVTDSTDLAGCAATRAQLNADDGDATGDRNAFWDARDYRTGLGNVTASVLAVHGLQDDNVRMDHLATWWAGLAARDVPRKLWLMRAGHADPFDVRRAEWVDTLHRWFDHWLYGIDNHIMDAPRVDVQDADGTWHAESDWPAPATQPVPLFLRATDQAAAGDVGLVSGGGADSVSWVNLPGQTETAAMATPAGAQANRRVFLTPPLKQPLRISGTPAIDLKASLSTTQSNLGAILVDYGAGSQVTRDGEGIANTTTRTCWGLDDTASGDFSACYLTVTQPQTAVTQWRVTKGILDSANRTSPWTPSAVTIGTPTDFPIAMVPQDHVFAAGHQLGVILVADYRGFVSVSGTAGATITMDTRASTITLPVVGGSAAAAASGAFDHVTPVLTLPADRSAQATTAAGATVTWTAPTATDATRARP
jgi:X-Pro dipeptidyl-peptidase